MFRRVLTIITLALVVFVIWNARSDIAQVLGYLADTNLFFIFLLIPEQLLLYYCSGQIFFSYLSAKARTSKSASSLAKLSSPWLFARISFELNFINQAIPSGGVAGLSYVTWRFKALGSSVGQTSFVYFLRYIITILANQCQTLLALLALILLGGISDGAWWVIGLTGLACAGITLGIVAIILIASSRKRIGWFARLSTKLVNGFIRGVTFGRKRQVIKYEVIEQHLDDVYENLLTARQNKKILLRPVLWGILYSLLEVATYWLVGISMGHPEILPQIMVAAAIASVVGVVMLTPGGIGGYEGAMIFVMSVLGIDPGLATAVVITTRVIILVGTLLSGYGFYQNAMSKVGKQERKAIMREVKK